MNNANKVIISKKSVIPVRKDISGVIKYIPETLQVQFEFSMPECEINELVKTLLISQSCKVELRPPTSRSR